MLSVRYQTLTQEKAMIEHNHSPNYNSPTHLVHIVCMLDCYLTRGKTNNVILPEGRDVIFPKRNTRGEMLSYPKGNMLSYPSDETVPNDLLELKPSCLQATSASVLEKELIHTVPHLPFKYTSRRPIDCKVVKSEEEFTSRKLPPRKIVCSFEGANPKTSCQNIIIMQSTTMSL